MTISNPPTIPEIAALCAEAESKDCPAFQAHRDRENVPALVAACRWLVAELTTARTGFEEANRDTYAAERANVEAATRISELLAENAKLRDWNDVLRDERLHDENLALCKVEIAKLRAAALRVVTGQIAFCLGWLSQSSIERHHLAQATADLDRLFAALGAPEHREMPR